VRGENKRENAPPLNPLPRGERRNAYPLNPLTYYPSVPCPQTQKLPGMDTRDQRVNKFEFLYFTIDRSNKFIENRIL
jgi:hypothetical protein